MQFVSSVCFSYFFSGFGSVIAPRELQCVSEPYTVKRKFRLPDSNNTHLKNAHERNDLLWLTISILFGVTMKNKYVNQICMYICFLKS